MSEVDTHAVSSHDNPPANGDVAVTAAKDPEQKSIVDYPHDPHGIISTTNDAVVEREREERSLTPARASRGRSRSRQRRSKSRSRSRQRRRSKSRSRSRQRRISKSRSRSRQRRRRRSKSRSRSQSRRRYQRRRRSRSRSRSVSRDRWHRRRYRGRERWSRSRSRDRDRRRGRYSRRRSASRSSGSDGGRSARNRARDRMRMIEDPFTKLRSTATAVNPVQVARQMREQQLKARLTVLQQQAEIAVAANTKPQREVYVGNITPGVVTGEMLHQLFTATLKAAFPDKCEDGDPVIYVNMAPEGKYGFVEMRRPEMATACLELNGQIPLGGNMLSIGRPAGFIDPARAHAAACAAAEALELFQLETMKMQEEQATSTQPSTGAIAEPGESNAKPNAEKMLQTEKAAEPTPFLVVDGIVCSSSGAPADEELREITSELEEEFGKHGRVLRLVVRHQQVASKEGHEGGVAEAENDIKETAQAYVQFVERDDAKKALAAIDGRLFSGQRVSVGYLSATAFLEHVDKKV